MELDHFKFFVKMIWIEDFKNLKIWYKNKTKGLIQNTKKS
jgi:hypothetical protein